MESGNDRFQEQVSKVLKLSGTRDQDVEHCSLTLLEKSEAPDDDEVEGDFSDFLDLPYVSTDLIDTVLLDLSLGAVQFLIRKKEQIEEEEVLVRIGYKRKRI